ncbi:hypothetical protein M3Y97_00592600 [Aphelenchoides bicaudatus]|nr:hypothetical protein M3Y97_00592600 [Aphelenchoides bicaudatus]
MRPNEQAAQASSSRKQLSSLEIIKRKRSCSRLLFGVPDRAELDEWLNRNADRRTAEAKSKWNFDFEHGVPLNTSIQSPSSSTYEYEKMNEAEVPAFYRSGPAKRKVVRLKRSRLNSNSSADQPTELKRSESAPAIKTTKIIRRTMKSLHRENGHIKKPTKPATSKDLKKKASLRKSPTSNKSLPKRSLIDC